MSMHGRRSRDRVAGFTLIEILVVMAILGVLVVTFLPNVLGAGKRGEITATRARLEFLAQAAKAFERKVGYYPPDNLIAVDGKAKAADNGINTGIESLVVFLCQQRFGQDSLADHEDWLQNTDDDQGATEIPLLNRRALVEVVDAWDAPIAYFSSQSGGYTGAQRIAMLDGDPEKVSAVKNPRTGKPLAEGSFQLVSAGPDGEFGTEDDVTYPELPRE
jgi:prepilin-type N-terminal cleavage/methylation domain-containing protein